ncbi:MAG: LLM class flavin-dependent oxidoreductase [Thermomicrobiales bacterium]
MAKEIATLDLLSGGRVLFGIGAGWHRGEMRNHGTDPRTRFELMREQVLVLKSSDRGGNCLRRASICTTV